MPTATPSTPRRVGGSVPPEGSGKIGTVQGGTYGIQDVVVGVKIFVRKPASSGELEERWAEILSSRPKPRSMYNPRKPEDNELDEVEYYVHYTEFNKRLDEWVGGSKLVIEKEMEWPKAPGEKEKEKEKEKEREKRPPGSNKKDRSSPSSETATPTRGASPASLRKVVGMKSVKAQGGLLKASKGKAAKKDANKVANKSPAGKAATPDKMDVDSSSEDSDDAHGEDDDADGDVDMEVEDRPSSQGEEGEVAEPSNPLAAQALSKDDEIRRLRTSGSMTQQHSEVSRVKNLKSIQMGKHQVESWYFSPYPIEYAHIDLLFLCEYCLSFYPSTQMLKRHLTKCQLRHPPGNEIYRDEKVSFFEIDGRRQRTWCRNLCLLSKCFLDHKTLYYDVDPFLFYCMVSRDENGCHLLGYFSKEKESADGYNVACILTLPQHQRKSYGKLLIEFSYELSKVEKRHGSPEKPLSDLGLLSYRAYWAEVIVALLLDTKEEISIEEIANKTCITPADVMHTCQALHMIKQYKNGYIINLTDAVISSHEATKRKNRHTLTSELLRWKPPVFTRSQLAFGF